MAGFPFRLCPSALLGCVCLSSGCSGYKPASDTLALSADGDGQQADWSCLQRPAQPTAPLGSVGDPIVYSIRMVDVLSQALLMDVTVQACGLADVECARPITPKLSPSTDGWVDVPLRDNFQGYLRIQSNDDSTLPQLFHLPDTGRLRSRRDFPIVMISKMAYEVLVNVLHVPDDPSLGAIAVRTFDCQNRLAAGVTLTNDTDGVPWYFLDGLPSIMRQETDLQGLAGFVGTTPGFTLSEATLADGTKISSQNLIVRPGWMSSGFLRPAQAKDPQ